MKRKSYTTLFVPILLSAFLTGCKNQVTVSVIGQGNISSTPEGITCGSGETSCNFSFPKNTNIKLIATPDSGYIFSNWEGSCAGNTPECDIISGGVQNVTANFAISGTDVTPPTPAEGYLNATDKDELSIAWKPSQDDTSYPSQLIYKVYISESRDSLFDVSNLAAQILGSQELFLTVDGKIPGTTYYCALIAVDESGNESSPVISSTSTPLDSPSVRDGVLTYASDDEGWGLPTYSAEEAQYTFQFSSDLTVPEVGSYIAYPDQEVDAYDLVSVTAISTTGNLVTVTARPALLFEVADSITYGGSIEYSSFQSNNLSASNAIHAASAGTDLTKPQINDPQLVSPASTVPSPSDDCNQEPTDELLFNPNLKIPLALEYNIDALDFNICSESLKDTNGNCPVSPKNTVLWKGDFTFTTTAGVDLKNQECLYKHYLYPMADKEIDVRKLKWVKKIKKWGRFSKKIAKFIPSIKAGYKLTTDIVYTGIAKSKINTKATMKLEMKDIAFGVNNMLRDPQKIFTAGSPTTSVNITADVKGSLNYDIYIVPTIEFYIQAAGQIEAKWKGEFQLQKSGIIDARTPDPLAPNDLYFFNYTLYAKTACYDSLSIDLGIVGVLIGDLVEQEYENREFDQCKRGPYYFFYVPHSAGTKGNGLVDISGEQYLSTTQYYLNPVNDLIDWDTVEYGILLLNGEMITYPTIFDAPKFYYSDPNTGFTYNSVNYYYPFPVPESILPKDYVKNAGGGTKYWMRANTTVGRSYIYLSDWQYP